MLKEIPYFSLPQKLPKPKIPKHIPIDSGYLEPKLSDFPVYPIPRLYYTIKTKTSKLYFNFYERPVFLGEKKIKRSYYAKEFFFTHLRNYNNVKQAAIETFGKRKSALLIIKIRRHNTFLCLHNNPNNVRLDLGKCRLKTTLSAGMLGFKGRKKGAPLVREALGKYMGRYILKMRYKIIDIFFKSKTGSMYRHIMKGLAKMRIGIRKIRIKHKHPHGYIRPKKRRRT